MSEGDRTKEAAKRTIVVNLTVTIDIRLTDHLIDLIVRQLLTCTLPPPISGPAHNTNDRCTHQGWS